MITLDNIEIVLPSNEKATWITVEDMGTLIEDGVLILENDELLTPEDGPFRIIIDENLEQ